MGRRTSACVCSTSASALFGDERDTPGTARHQAGSVQPMGSRMKVRLATLFLTGGLAFPPLAALSSETKPLSSVHCYAGAGVTLPVISPRSFKDNNSVPVDPRYHAPTSSPRLNTLDVLRIGLSLDTYRQGQVWNRLQETIWRSLKVCTLALF